MKNTLIWTLAFFALPTEAAIIETQAFSGLEIEYRDQFGNWISDATAADSANGNAPVDITGNNTGIDMSAEVGISTVSLNQGTANIDLSRSGHYQGGMTTSGFPSAIWGNRFEISYFAEVDTIFTYGWEIIAPAMTVPSFSVAMADVIFDNDSDISNGYLGIIRSANDPGVHTGSSSVHIDGGSTYDFVVSAYHYHSFTPDYEITSSFSGEFAFNFDPVAVSEPPLLLLIGTGIIELLAVRKAKHVHL